MSAVSNAVQPPSMSPTKKSRVLATGDVARLFGVDPRTVNRWVRTGRVPHFRTPGGQCRFREDDLVLHVVVGEGAAP